MLLMLEMPKLPPYTSAVVHRLSLTREDVLHAGSLADQVFEYLTDFPGKRLTADDISIIFSTNTNQVNPALKFAINEGFINIEVVAVHDGIGKVRTRVYSLGMRK